MKKRKSFGRKIKRTKNLYRPKKTKKQKIIGTVIFIIIVIIIGFIGFFLGKPILDFFGRPETEREEAWTPPVTEISEAPEPEETEVTEITEVPGEQPVISGTENESNSENSEDKPAVISGNKALTLSVGALSNRASLAAALAKGKNMGYNGAVILLKDEKGYFHYKSDIKELSDKELVIGELKLSEITEAFREADMTPIAEISVLKDNKGAAAFSDISYKCYGEDTSWLDYYSTGEPLRWICPDSNESKAYMDKIYDEIAASGINNIILSNIIFPPLQNYDKRYLSSDYFADDRHNMLYGFIREGMTIKIRAEDILSGEYGGTAEILKDKAKLKGSKIALVIDRESFPPEEGYPADDKGLIEDILSGVSEKIGGDIPIIPVISVPEGEKAAEITEKMGYKSYIIR